MNTMRIHISIAVSDLSRSVAFYERLFGQPVSKLRDDYANFRLDAPPIHLALAPATGPVHDRAPGSAGSLSHFGIELPDAASFTAWRDRLRGTEGVRWMDEQDAICCYASADKMWLTDPDGNEWEVWVRKADAETMTDGNTRCCAAA